ncbi:P-loop containing nucleoside triphosphate hydrolase protein [Crucibulum laeve]|uniref:P-loop containing nucleoside triphosphate hydrolase protein n=1 Tax=Crucibulum laeve TaxID=68775 RepID=A0A5C3M0E0_9AGAR|nr:P-loop containing nucleoside triphosphate hydrolase protein [Crucibulum laeve]
MGRRQRQRLNRKGTFDPTDASTVKHSHIGVWDLYEDIQPEFARVPGASRFESLFEMANALPYVWRMMKDIGSIRACWFLLSIYLAIEFVASLLPAVALWYSGQLLKIVQTAVDERTVDTHLLFKVAFGRFVCSLITRLLRYSKQRLAVPLNVRIKQYYSVHIFHAMARLDVPTFDDAAVQRQLEQSFPPNSRSSIAWDTVVMALHMLSTALQLTSQLSVLVGVLRDQRDGPLLAVLSFAHALFQWSTVRKAFISAGVWAATTKDPDYIRNEGLKRAIAEPSHRKEIVAGGMWPYLLSQYQHGVNIIADRAGDFFEAASAHRTRDRLSFSSMLQDPFKELPQIVFTLRAVQYPAAIPLSLASLNLITQTTQSFTYILFNLFDETGSIADKLASVRKLYEVGNIPNRIVDGNIPFPEDTASIEQGLSIEFRNVSFSYPGSTPDEWALRNVSFKIEKGQLCVIVGANGSGKSTILKLVARLYDPSEGTILINGLDIQTLRLADLRRATSVLFQDYTHFPLSIRDNIALGAPDPKPSMDDVHEAARLGGAEELVQRLPDGFDTYLERPVRDYYSGLPEGTTTLFGRPVDYSRVRGMGGMDANGGREMSGGQMQRIALSRTFMRSVVSETSVGLLLFDEPSASLDPTAEHDLFNRLRQLRGSKTMVFSSHRFGNLTRHADLILYMNDSVIVEEGTHDQLLRRDGEYARIWKLQAQAFL